MFFWNVGCSKKTGREFYGRSAIAVLTAALLLVAWQAKASMPYTRLPGPIPLERQYALLRLALQEYREASLDPEKVDEHELHTAEQILDELGRRAPSDELEAIRRLVARRAEQAELLAAFSLWVRAYGAGIEPQRPERPPSIHSGRQLFDRYCVSCHGANGDGRGELARAIEGPKPANFTDAVFAGSQTPEEFFLAITTGVPATAMPDWSEVLTAEERWDLVAYLWTLHGPEPDTAAADSCRSCHIRPPASLGVSDNALLEQLTRIEPHSSEAGSDGLRLVALARRLGFVDRRSEEGSGERTIEPRHVLAALDLAASEYRDGVRGGKVIDAVEYGEAKMFFTRLDSDLRALRDRELLGDDRVNELTARLGRAIYGKAEPEEIGRRATALREVLLPLLGVSEHNDNAIERVLAILLGAERVAPESPGDASALVFDAYLAFEGVEKRLAARNAGLASSLEREFTRLRTAVTAGQDAKNYFVGLRHKLARASKVLAGNEGKTSTFVTSLVIILREGLEAILILSALAAYLSRGGHLLARRWLYEGALAGVAASLATAVLFQALFEEVQVGQEVIEGATMLVAALVLFSVSYWLISKVEARHWQSYVHERLHHALGKGSRAAMAGVAFLAVYREGFETVLFYRALAGEESGSGAVLAGLAGGCLILLAVYVAIARFSVRIPLRPFFSLTGILLYLLAFRFLGGGVAELQGAGVLPATPVGWWPEISWLDMASNLETGLAQLTLIGAALLAVLVTGLRPRLGRG